MPLTDAHKPGTALTRLFLGDPDDFLNGKTPKLRKLLVGSVARKRTLAIRLPILVLRYLKCFR
jgi:hypothetical protein